MTTFKAVKAELASKGMTIRKVEGEYRVNFVGGAEATAYYSDSLGDALRTGLLMVEERSKGSILPDSTPIETLGQLNAMLKPEAQGWIIRRSPAGYYYYTHNEKINSLSGTYVFSCKGTTLGFWRRELAAVIEEAR